MNKTVLFTIGRVTSVHGLNGNLKVCSFAHSIETFRSGREVFLKADKNPGNPFNILKAMSYKKGILLSLKGVDNRTFATSFIGSEILINKDQLPKLKKDTWYWEDLINLDVIDQNKGFIGRVKKIFSTNAHDILVVKNDTNETLVPIHDHFVKTIDVKQNAIKIILPENY